MEEIKEYDEPKELAPCPHCQRKFLPDRLEKHWKLCNADKPFKKPGEQMDSNVMPSVRVS